MSGEEDGVSTTTGATPEQIEAAIRRFHERWGRHPEPDSDLIEFTANNEYITMREAADLLVPPGMVIASAADVAKVPTAEEIAAMRWISAYPFSRSEVASKCRAVFSAYLERVTG